MHSPNRGSTLRWEKSDKPDCNFCLARARPNEYAWGRASPTMRRLERAHTQARCNQAQDTATRRTLVAPETDANPPSESLRAFGLSRSLFSLLSLRFTAFDARRANLSELAVWSISSFERFNERMTVNCSNHRTTARIAKCEIAKSQIGSEHQHEHETKHELPATKLRKIERRHCSASIRIRERSALQRLKRSRHQTSSSCRIRSRRISRGIRRAFCHVQR